jgi:hypothetical protein
MTRASTNIDSLGAFWLSVTVTDVTLFLRTSGIRGRFRSLRIGSIAIRRTGCQFDRRDYVYPPEQTYFHYLKRSEIRNGSATARLVIWFRVLSSSRRFDGGMVAKNDIQITQRSFEGCWYLGARPRMDGVRS